METFLLDKRYKFILEMVNEVSKVTTKEIPTTELQNKLNLSKKTVRTYFQTLEQFCKSKNLKTFTMDNGKFEMDPNTNFNVFDLYHFSILNSTKYQIMMTLWHNPRVLLTNIHLDVAISRSNCAIHILQLNEFLEGYNCALNFARRRPMQGETHQIRFLFYNLFWGLDLDEIVINSPDIYAAIQFISDRIPGIDYATLSKIKLHLHIFKITSKQEYHISPEVDFTIQDSPYITYDDFFEKLDELNFFRYCPDLATKEQEGRYLYFLFCRQNVLTLEVCQQFANKISYSDDPNVHYFITQFQEDFQITLRDSEIVCLSYNLSLFFREASLFHGRAKTFDLERLVTIFNDTRKMPSESIQMFLEYIYTDNKEILTLIENFPSLHLYCTMLLRVILAKYQHPIKLLVQSSVSTLHREAIIKQIKDSTPFPVTILDSDQLNGEKPDGIISNWLPDRKFEDIPFFSISLFFNDWNKADLSQFLSRVSAKKLIA